MKAISVRQPYASWIAEGKKSIETRQWKVNYRGDILIVSSKTTAAGGVYPLGQALCVVRLSDCRPMIKEDEIAARVKFSPTLELYSWILTNIRRIEPFPVTGKQGFFDVQVDFDLTFL